MTKEIARRIVRSSSPINHHDKIIREILKSWVVTMWRRQEEVEEVMMGVEAIRKQFLVREILKKRFGIPLCEESNRTRSEMIQPRHLEEREPEIVLRRE